MTKDEALRLAMAALVKTDAEPGSKAWEREAEAITAIKEALAQPEQEPVAWMFQHEETGRMMFVETQQLEWGFEKGNPRLKKIRPVYTTPPQHLPLTDEEVTKCWGQVGGTRHGYVAFARAIEAAVWEKQK